MQNLIQSLQKQTSNKIPHNNMQIEHKINDLYLRIGFPHIFFQLTSYLLRLFIISYIKFWINFRILISHHKNKNNSYWSMEEE